MRHILFAAVLLGGPSLAAAAPPCDSNDLALLLDAGSGELNGMSHSGTMLSLHNTGKTACLLPTRPALALAAATGAPVETRMKSRNEANGHAPAATIELPPGVEAKGSLRWVSGAVDTPGHCADAVALRVTLPGGGIDSPIHAHVCGPAGQPFPVEQGDMQLPSAH